MLSLIQYKKYQVSKLHNARSQQWRLVTRFYKQFIEACKGNLDYKPGNHSVIITL
jgi:hypothetical protein